MVPLTRTEPLASVVRISRDLRGTSFPKRCVGHSSKQPVRYYFARSHYSHLVTVSWKRVC